MVLPTEGLHRLRRCTPDPCVATRRQFTRTEALESKRTSSINDSDSLLHQQRIKPIPGPPRSLASKHVADGGSPSARAQSILTSGRTHQQIRAHKLTQFSAALQKWFCRRRASVGYGVAIQWMVACYSQKALWPYTHTGRASLHTGSGDEGTMNDRCEIICIGCH
mgnify:CR=1 FL=1